MVLKLVKIPFLDTKLRISEIHLQQHVYVTNKELLKTNNFSLYISILVLYCNQSKKEGKYQR